MQEGKVVHGVVLRRKECRYGKAYVREFKENFILFAAKWYSKHVECGEGTSFGGGGVFLQTAFRGGKKGAAGTGERKYSQLERGGGRSTDVQHFGPGFQIGFSGGDKP